MRLDESPQGKNRRLFLLIYLFVSVAGGLCAEGYVQAYMLEGGVSLSRIGLYGTISQFAALASYAAYPSITYKRGSHAFLVLLSALFVLYPLFFLLAGLPPSPDMMFLCMLPGAVIYSGVGALKSTCEFALLPRLFSRDQYAGQIAKGGMIGCAVAALMSFAGGFAGGGAGVYRAFFAFAAGSLAVSAYLTRAYEPLPGEDDASKGMPFKDMLRKLASRQSARLLFPHLLRGVAMGGMYYLLALTLKRVPLAGDQTSLLITVSVLGSFAANFLFLRVSRRMSSRNMIFFANAVCSLMMVALLFVRSTVGFLAVYALYYVANILSQNVVPTGVLRSTPSAELPFVSAMRMLAMSVASALTIFALSVSVDVMPGWIVPVGSAVLYTVTGCLYARQFDDRFA